MFCCQPRLQPEQNLVGIAGGFTLIDIDIVIVYDAPGDSDTYSNSADGLTS